MLVLTRKRVQQIIIVDKVVIKVLVMNGTEGVSAFSWQSLPALFQRLKAFSNNQHGNHQSGHGVTLDH